MKKLLLPILLLLALSGGAYWWVSVIEVQRSPATIQSDDARLRVWYNLVCPTYADTTGANSNLGLDYIGALIHTKSPAAIYFRDTSTATHKWTILATTPASPIWGLITGTLSSQTDLQTALNAKQNNIALGTTAQYFRGDLSLATFPTDLSSFTNGPGYLTGINVTMSITGTGSVSTPLKLINDASSPGANMYYGTDNGGTKGWQADALIKNIYNSNGDINDDRYLGGPVSGATATKSLYLDSILNFQINSSGKGNGMTVDGYGGTSVFSVAGNEISETSFNPSFTGTSFNAFLGDSSELLNYTGADTSEIHLLPNVMLFYQHQGGYKIWNLVKSNDSTYKPMAVNPANGNMYQLDHWPGSGGGGGGVALESDETYSSGSTFTQGSGKNYTILNPSSVQSALTITTLASGGTWHNSNDWYVLAGGTITSGNPVITTLTITAGSGMTLVQAVGVTTINAGEVIHYHKNGNFLYRIN